jgi:hypothetical protein
MRNKIIEKFNFEQCSMENRLTGEQEIECPASQYILGGLSPDALIVRS